MLYVRAYVHVYNTCSARDHTYRHQDLPARRHMAAACGAWRKEQLKFHVCKGAGMHFPLNRSPPSTLSPLGLCFFR